MQVGERILDEDQKNLIFIIDSLSWILMIDAIAIERGNREQLITKKSLSQKWFLQKEFDSK